MADRQEAEGFYIRLQQEFPREFVALRNGKAVAHAVTYEGVADALAREGILRSEVTVMFVDSPEVICVYHLPAG